MIKLTMYNETQWSLCRMPDSFFYERNYKPLKKFNTTSPEEVERISKSRTKNRIKEICLCNSFEYFCTLTVNSKSADRFSLQQVQDLIKKRMKKIQRKYNDFKYIYITEKHEKGGFHFHGFIKGIPLDKLILFTVNDFIPYKLLALIKKGNKIYHSSLFDDIGWNTFEKIRDYNKCCNYITKYITKDCVKNEHNQIYFCSRGLKKAKSEYMIDYDLFDIFKFAKIYKNEFCQKYDFDITKLPVNHSRNLNAFFFMNDQMFQKDNNYISNLLKLFTENKVNIKI